SPDRQVHTWNLGPAKVRLLPMSVSLAKRPHEFRRQWLRPPLAYPPTGVGAMRAQLVRAWKADLQVERAKQAGGLRAVSLEARWFAARAYGKWVTVRRGTNS